jgi:hypothetical protein
MEGPSETVSADEASHPVSAVVHGDYRFGAAPDIRRYHKLSGPFAGPLSGVLY